MAQTTHPPSAAPPRALPRRGPSLKAVRPPRLVPQDGAWMVVLTALSLGLSLLAAPAAGHRPGGALAAAGTALLVYLLGWRARDRATGVVAGLLLATSLPFALHAVAVPREAAFVLLMVAALFSFVAGSSLLALAGAGMAALTQPAGLLLGLLLLGLSFAQRRKRAAWGSAFFLGIVLIGWGMQTGLWHERLPSPHGDTRDWLPAWALAPGTVFLTWLLLPFCAELGEVPRRTRWLPVVLWTLLFVVVSSFVQVGGTRPDFVLTPLWFVLAAAGLSRLLPPLTGEIPLPWVRYGLAALAVLSLVAIRLRAEWPHPQLVIQKAAAPPAAVPPAEIPLAAIAVPAAVATLHHAASPAPPPHPSVAPKPATVAKSPPKPLTPAPKPQPKPVLKKTAPVSSKPHQVVRARAAYHHYYRPRPVYRRSYRRYYRHY